MPNSLKITQIKEICLYFHDLEKAKEFYGTTLAFEIISHVREKHIFFRVGSSVLLCFNPDDSGRKKSPPPHYSEGPYHLAFEVKANEYLNHKNEILAKGVSIIDTVTWKNGQESFYFNDPNGNILEIVPEGIWN